MVLNLMMRNSLAPFPGRVWKKKGLPLLAIDKPMVTTMKTGLNISRPAKAAKKSKKRFNPFLYMEGSSWFRGLKYGKKVNCLKG